MIQIDDSGPKNLQIGWIKNITGRIRIYPIGLKASTEDNNSILNAPTEKIKVKIIFIQLGFRKLFINCLYYIEAIFCLPRGV